jgi:uncharacterized repeat protein (TIGR04076 family)
MVEVKITVIKRTVNDDIIKEYVKDEYQEMKPCEQFSEGQEFIVNQKNVFKSPKGFCEWAWADIRHDILTLYYGGKTKWLKKDNMNIVGCTDWFRPVYFLLERIE